MSLEICISKISYEENGEKKRINEKVSDYRHGAAVISTEAVYAILQIEALDVPYSGPYLIFVMHKSLQASDDPYSIYSLHCCMSAQNWLLYRSSEVNSVSIKVVASRQRWYRFGWYAMNTSLC